MAITDTLDRLPPWALYGGAGVAVGGGYLLYRRRKASASGSAASSTAPAAVQSALDLGSQTQQSSVVPYYLTEQSGQQASTTMDQRRPPRTIPSSVPSPTGVSSGSGAAQLPDIPPLLPPSSPGAPAPVPAPAPPAPPPPPAVTQNNNLSGDLLAKIRANGETIVDSIAAPGGGQWYLSDKGGIFAINAPFYGAAISQPYFGGGRKAMRLVPNGKGYSIVTTSGETYGYPG